MRKIRFWIQVVLYNAMFSVHKLQCTLTGNVSKKVGRKSTDNKPQSILDKGGDRKQKWEEEKEQH